MGENRLIEWIRLLMQVVVLQQMMTTQALAQGDKSEAIDQPFIRDLAPVIIKSAKPVAVRKGDTVLFDANRFKNAVTFSLADLLHQLPGFRVEESGRIYFNGKEVSRLLIDGDDITGDQYGLLTSRLRAGIISKVQLIEKYQPSKILRSIQPGNQVAVNLVMDDKTRKKPSGLLHATSGSKRYNLLADLVKLNKVKSLLFTRMANLQNQQQWHQDNLTEVVTLWKDDAPFVLPASGLQQLNLLPAMYQKIQQTGDGAWMLFAKPDTMTQLKVLFKTNLAHFLLEEQEAQDFFPNESLNYLRKTKRNDHYSSHQGKIEWDRSIHDKRSSAFQLLWLKQFNVLRWQQYQTGFLSFQDQFNQRTSDQMLQIRFEEMLKYNNGVLKLETGFGISQLNDQKVFVETPVMQYFNYHRKSARMHLTWIAKPGRIQLTKGMMLMTEKNQSKLNESQAGSGYFKLYPYITIQYVMNKKWRQILQLAGGGLTTFVHRKTAWYGVYHAELRTEWQKKPTLNFYVTAQAQQKMQDGASIAAGPYYLNSRTRWESQQQFTVPRTVQLQIGVVKMNLYSGLILNAHLQARHTQYEQGMQVAFEAAQQTLSAFVIPKRFNGNGQVNIEKYFHFAQVRYAGTISYHYFDEPRMFNRIQLKAITGNTQVTHSISSHWKIPFNLSAYYNYSLATFSPKKSKDTRSLVRSHKTGCSLSYQLSRKGMVQLQYSYIRTGQQTRFKVLDAFFTYALHQRWKLNINAHNLMNNTVYQVVEMTTWGRSDYSRQLIGRNVMLGMQWSF